MSGRYPREFFAWAYAHGWPERGPRGSEINKVRAKMLPGLHSQWLKEHQGANEGPITLVPSVYPHWVSGQTEADHAAII